MDEYETTYDQQLREETFFEDQQAGVILCFPACAPARVLLSSLTGTFPLRCI